MMTRTELCAWLRANSSGIYRPATDAADEIEQLAAAKEQHFAQAMANGAKANEYRSALEKIAALDYKNAATNCAAYHAVHIATEACNTAHNVEFSVAAPLSGAASAGTDG